MPNDDHILEGDAVVQRLIQVEDVVCEDELSVVCIDDNLDVVVDVGWFHIGHVELVIEW